MHAHRKALQREVHDFCHYSRSSQIAQVVISGGTIAIVSRLPPKVHIVDVIGTKAAYVDKNAVIDVINELKYCKHLRTQVLLRSNRHTYSHAVQIKGYTLAIDVLTKLYGEYVFNEMFSMTYIAATLPPITKEDANMFVNGDAFNDAACRSAVMTSAPPSMGYRPMVWDEAHERLVFA